MGDSLAVEVAQAAHRQLLKDLCGAMLDHEVLRYRFPCPRTDFVELLAIDDHVGLQKVTREQFASQTPLRDSQVFAASEVAYKQVGLVQHEHKRKRQCLTGTILGCDFDGNQGIVSAPRNRIILLAFLTIRIVHLGTCTPKLLSVILGCWVHALLYRRVVFAVLNSVFTESQGLPQNQIFCLSQQTKNELQILASLAPLLQSDLRVKYSEHIYTTDASPWGGAVCKAKLGTEVTKELWRHCEQKGFYTKLASPVSSILAEKGLETEGQLFGSDLVLDEHHPHLVFHPSETLSEGFLFDGIEIFRGTGNWSRAHEQLGLCIHDSVDVDGRRLRCLDLSEQSVFRELVALALRGVIRDWHAGMPCLSFGTLRRPKVRTKRCPYGFNPQDPFTKFHNCLAQRTAIILLLAMRHGAFISVEQPGGSCLYHMHLYTVLVRLGCIITRFCFCAFGSALQKQSKWLHNKPWMEELSCKCTCDYKGRHFVAQGNFTKESLVDFDNRCKPNCKAVYGVEPHVGQSVANFSGAYPLALVSRLASGAAAAKSGVIGRISHASRFSSYRELGLETDGLETVIQIPDPPYPPRKWFEDPDWIGELCNSVDFKECFRYRFSRSGHINVNESRTYKSWIKSLAKNEADSRVVGILDSRVTIGATAKGRSSSYGISRILQGNLGYVLGANLFPATLHCASQDNRADEPSRDKPVRPANRPIPSWLADLQNGKTDRFDVVCISNRVPKSAAKWLRLLLLLGGDIERNPGPSRRTPAGMPRGPMNLATGFHPATADRMTRCLQAFRTWLQHEFPDSHDDILAEGSSTALALRAYGMHCFQSGLPRYLFVYAITSVQDRWPQYKPYMTPAWQIDKKWQLFEPGECRSVLPPSAIRAAVCLAVLWKWYQWAGLVLIGFGAMLHPGEMIPLIRRDLVLPRDTAFDSRCMFVHVRDPKTARFARRQHGRIDDEQIIAVVDHLFGSLPLSAKLFDGSITVFRRQWNAIMSKLQIPCLQKQRGATPGVLRGSGATFLYHHSEDVQWVAWRGRWSKHRTLEFYLQEVSAQLLVHELSPFARSFMFELDKCAWPVLCRTFSLRSRIT